MLKSESHPTEADSCHEDTADIHQCYSHTCGQPHTELENEDRDRVNSHHDVDL